MSAVRLFDRFKNLLDVSWGSVADGQYLRRSGTDIIGGTPAGGGGSGDVVGPASSVANELSIYADTTGKLLGRLTPPAGVLVGTTATQTLTGKTLTSPVINTPTGIVKGDVGLGNVDNTSDVNKPVSTAQQSALDGKQPLDSDLTAIAAIAPANDDIIQRKTGAWTNRTTSQFKTDLALTKSDVGLANVDNTSDANKPVSTATQTALNLKEATANKAVANGYASLGSDGKVPTAQLPAGGTGDVVGQISSVDSEVALFSGTGGKTIKRATGTGYVTVVSGVYQTPTAADLVGRMPKGHLHGLTLANNGTDVTNDIDIAIGEARDSTNAVDMILSGALTKRLDAAWAVGTNQGGRDTGSIADNTWHVWLIKRVDTGVVDVLFSLSATAPTMPTNYTYKRRIGSIIRASAAITRFVQNGDIFDLYVNPATFSGTVGLTAVLQVLNVPVGISVRAIFHAGVSKASFAPGLMVTSVSQSDQDPVTANAPIFAAGAGLYGYAVMETWTNTSGQVRLRASQAASDVTIISLGWFDSRGKDT